MAVRITQEFAIFQCSGPPGVKFPTRIVFGWERKL